MPKRVDGQFDPENLFQKGESFQATSMYLRRQPMEVLAPTSFAMVTCSAFACEVYLKVLAHLEHGLRPLQTHSLKFLFFDLAAVSQKAIEDKWTTECLPDLTRGWGDAPVPKEIIRPASFRQALELSSTTFVDWRYETGNEKPLYFHLLGLAPIVRPMILALKPEYLKGYRRGAVYPRPSV